MAGFKAMAGGEIKTYTDMTNEARGIAEQRMIAQAQAMGADAIVAMRVRLGGGHGRRHRDARLRNRRQIRLAGNTISGLFLLPRGRARGKENDMSSIRIGLLGYGNLGRGVELACAANPDTELVAVFTRRDPSRWRFAHRVRRFTPQLIWRSTSMTSMCWCSRAAARPIFPSRRLRQRVLFNVVDSFDTHANIPRALRGGRRGGARGRQGRRHLRRLGFPACSRFRACTPTPSSQTGRTTRSGDVASARVTPTPSAAYRASWTRVRERFPFPPRSMPCVRGDARAEHAREAHARVLLVVAEEGADKAAIEQAIVTMPTTSPSYDTTVTFITEEELQRVMRASRTAARSFAPVQPALRARTSRSSSTRSRLTRTPSSPAAFWWPSPVRRIV